MTQTDALTLAALVPFYTRHGHEVLPSKGALIRPRRGVFALVRSSENVLLIWPACAKGMAQLPGGGIEEGETLDQAMAREWGEETGMDMSCLHGPLKTYNQVRGFFADDCNEFWIYDQTFHLYDFVVSVSTGDKWRNGEGDMAGWDRCSRLMASRVNQAHWLAIKALAPDLTEAANEE